MVFSYLLEIITSFNAQSYEKSSISQNKTESLMPEMLKESYNNNIIRLIITKNREEVLYLHS
jgi:hypothetical protein